MLLSLAAVLVAFLVVPDQKVEAVPKVNYSFKRAFTHKAEGLPPSPSPSNGSAAAGSSGPADPVYFTNTVDHITGSFSYGFHMDGPLSHALTGKDYDAGPANSTVSVVAEVGSPGVWTKEVVLLPETEKQGDFTVEFPLEPQALIDFGARVAEELGGGAPAQDITLKATVDSVVETPEGTVRDQFVQTAGVSLNGNSVRFVRPFQESERGVQSGLAFSQSGAFDYAVAVRPTLL